MNIFEDNKYKLFINLALQNNRTARKLARKELKNNSDLLVAA